MNVHFKRKIKKIVSPLYRIGLKNRNFTILSNNCWGGLVYDKFGMRYNSPTIGLIMPSKSFLTFISNLDYYILKEAVPATLNDLEKASLYVKKASELYPIGIIDGTVFLIFVHYKSIEDGISKWNKRVKRIQTNNLLIKFNDTIDYDCNNYSQFCKVPFKNKLYFYQDKNLILNSSIINVYSDNGDSWKYLPVKKLKGILNNLE